VYFLGVKAGGARG